MPVRSRSPAPSKACRRAGIPCSATYFRRIRDDDKVDKDGWTAPALKAGDIGRALPSQLPWGRRSSGSRRAPLSEPEPAIPVAAHGVHRVRRGDDDPLPQRVRVGSRPRRRDHSTGRSAGSASTAPDRLPRGSHDIPGKRAGESGARRGGPGRLLVPARLARHFLDLRHLRRPRSDLWPSHHHGNSL